MSKNRDMKGREKAAILLVALGDYYGTGFGISVFQGLHGKSLWQE